MLSIVSNNTVRKSQLHYVMFRSQVKGFWLASTHRLDHCCLYVFCPESGPAPTLESTLKDEDSANPLNPFDEPDPDPKQPEYKNPFDESELESLPPKGSAKKTPRPVDMSKYLYADSSKTEEAEELDEWVGDGVGT